MVSQKSGLVPHQLETKNSDAPETKTATAETPTGGAAAGGLALLPVFWRLPVGHTTSAINEREHPRELTCILIGRSILAGFTCRTTPQVCYINPELCTTSTMRTLRLRAQDGRGLSKGLAPFRLGLTERRMVGIDWEALTTVTGGGRRRPTAESRPFAR